MCKYTRSKPYTLVLKHNFSLHSLTVKHVFPIPRRTKMTITEHLEQQEMDDEDSMPELEDDFSLLEKPKGSAILF